MSKVGKFNLPKKSVSGFIAKKCFLVPFFGKKRFLTIFKCPEKSNRLAYRSPKHLKRKVFLHRLILLVKASLKKCFV